MHTHQAADREQALKRMAMGIVVQLPDNIEEAKLVLQFSEALIAGYICGDKPRDDEQAGNVTRLRVVT